jgi:AAA domain
MKDPLADGFHEMVEDGPPTADKKTETPRANGCDATPSTLTGRVDYADRLLNAAIGADINDAQSRRILSMLNRAMHPDKEVEPIVLGETLGSIAWDERTWTEKKEIVQHVRPRIRSALSLLNREIDQTKGEIPPWVHSDFHVEWYRIQISGGWPNLIRPGHTCRVVDVRPKGVASSAPLRVVALTMSEWLERKFPARDELMGACFTTTSRSLLSADTGLGKTSLVAAIQADMAAGRDFLHWRCRRPSRVLLVDGEMSGEWLQTMIKDVRRRLGLVTDNLCFLNAEDYPAMPPFNSKEGFAFLRGYVEAKSPSTTS